MKRTLSLLTMVAFIAVALAACKPTTKGETDSWEANKKALNEAVTAFPAFKAVLDKKMADAQAKWDEALKQTKEEEKAKAMKAANEFLNDLVNQFSQVSSKTKGVEDAIAKFNAKKLDKAQDLVRYKAVNEAQKALKEVADTMAKAKAATEEEAKAVTKDVIGKLIGIQGDIDRAIKSVEPKAAPKKKK